MNATTHPFAPEEIMAFLDRETTADQSQAISTHIDSCAECRTLSQQLQQTQENVASWKVGEVPLHLETYFQSVEKNPELVKASTGEKLLHPSRWTKTQWLVGFATVGGCSLLLVALNTPRAFHSAEQVSTFHIGKDRPASQPITDQQSKVFTNRIPSKSGASTLTTLATPGVAADSNGLFHGLGDHAQNSFSVDGQPIVDQQSRVFAGPMIAHTVALAIVVKDFGASRAGIDAILLRQQGYTANVTINTPQGAARSLQASLRVPIPQLAAAITELKALGRVESESQNGEEVTQQHADLVARLKISRETERRFVAILHERTGNINEVLNAEQSIARVRGEIEQMEAEQKNLEHRVDFATIDLTLSEEYKAQLGAPAPSVSTLLHNALVNGLRTAADSVLSLVLFFSESGPVFLLWLLILALPIWQLWRRYRRAAAAI
jgi:anti-sigma factor RsiW